MCDSIKNRDISDMMDLGLGESEERRALLQSRKHCCSGTSEATVAGSRTVSRKSNTARLTLRLAVGLGLLGSITAAYPTDAADCASRSFTHPSYSAPVLCTTVCNAKKNSSDQREFCTRNCPGFYQDCAGEPRQTPLTRLQPSTTSSVVANNDDDLIHTAVQPLPSERADLNQSAVYNGSAGITAGWNERSSLVYIVPAAIAAFCGLVIIFIIVAIVLRREWIKRLERGQRPHAQETGVPDLSAVPMIQLKVTPTHRLLQ